jgi:RIO-like serine/threonine protein kinase
LLDGLTDVVGHLLFLRHFFTVRLSIMVDSARSGWRVRGAVAYTVPCTPRGNSRLVKLSLRRKLEEHSARNKTNKESTMSLLSTRSAKADRAAQRAANAAYKVPSPLKNEKNVILQSFAKQAEEEKLRKGNYYGVIANIIKT